MNSWTEAAWPLLVSAALKSTLVLGAAWIITVLLRGRSAAARHVVWTACAAALLALPVLSISLPAFHWSAANVVLPADDSRLVFHATTTSHAAATPAAASPANSARATSTAPAAAPAVTWRSALIWLWIAGIAVTLTQMILACMALWRARRAAPPSRFTSFARGLTRDLGIRDAVEILEIPGGMPMTFGVLRPTVFVPACASEWSEERRRVVLLHELAHVRRGDAATHLIARAALAVNWWNPLAWTAWRAFLREREQAADDLVLTAGAAATDYASHLVEIARTLQSQPAMAAAGIPMARSSQLEERLVAILDSRTRRTQPGRLAGLAVAAAAIALMAPLAAIRAQSTAEQQALPDVDVTIASANAQKNREILDQAAQSYEALRKFDQARKLREAALALTEQVSGQQSADYALALVRLGDLARRKGSIKESEEFYQRALALGDRPGIFPALMRLAFGSKDNDKAREYLERARVVGKDGNQVGSAMTWLAHQRQSEPNGVSYAESLYRGAMALEGPESPELALTLELYGQWKASLGDDSDAEPLLDRAKTIRKAVIVQKSAGIPRAPYSDPVVRVGGGVSAPALLKKMEPEYSEEARMLKLQGTVLLKIVVDVDGRAKNFELLRGLGYGLDEKAVDAVALWKFKPGTTRDGNPVPVQAQIEINFRLL